MDSLRRLWEAAEAFWDALGSVQPAALGVAVALTLLNLGLRSAAWRTILAAAYPAVPVRLRWSFGAYVAGVGINGVVPARAGDLLKLVLIHRRVEGSTYPTLASSLLVETLFDLPVALLLMLWAWRSGVLPDVSLPDVPAFELSWFARHPMVTGTILIVAAGAAAAALVIGQHRIRSFRERVEQGFAVLRTPRRYLSGVVALQAAGWCCRVAAAWFFLEAFNVEATLANALLVLVTQSVATVMPFTPGGVGPKQALLAVVLAGSAPQSTILAFSIGMEAVVVTVNLVVGLTATAIMLRGFGIRGAMAEARAGQGGADEGHRVPSRR